SNWRCLMTPSRTRLRLPVAFAVLALGAALLLPAPGPATAGGPPYGIPTGGMPWEYSKYYGYQERARPATPPPTVPVARSPVKYTIRITILPYQHTYDDRDVALMIAHLPDDARIWFDGAPTTSTGPMRYFTSPLLKPGKRYSYTIQVQWHEDGQW